MRGTRERTWNSSIVESLSKGWFLMGYEIDEVQDKQGVVKQRDVAGYGANESESSNRSPWTFNHEHNSEGLY